MTNLVATYAPSTTRSDNLQNCGMQFVYTGTSGLLVTQLGAWKITGNTGTWTISLRDNGNTTVLASATISMAGAAAGQFNYAACTPFSLTNGVQYKLVVNIPVGQTFPDNTAVTTNNATSLIGIFVVPNSVGGGTGSGFGSNNQYGGVDMVFGPAVVPGASNFFFAG